MQTTADTAPVPSIWATVKEAILTGIVGAVVLLALLSPLYFFLKALRPR